MKKFIRFFAVAACLYITFSFLVACAGTGRYEEQWGMLNSGREVCGYEGLKGVDVNIAGYWDEIAAIDSIPLIGIIDEGVDFSSGYLAGSQSALNTVSVISEHGTNVASIITTNHSYGEIKGCLNNAPLLQAVYDPNAADSIRQVIEGIAFLEANGVRVVNCSFTIGDFDQSLYDAMASSKMLFVCAAGERGGDNPAYPAHFDLDNVLCVGGISNCGVPSVYSYYSYYTDSNDILAPGENILTVGLEEELSYVNGTSVAAPFVTAACALIGYYDPEATAAEIKQVLLETSRKNLLANYLIPAGLVDFGAIVKYYSD